MKKRSILLLITAILSTIYSIYMITYFSGSLNDAGGVIATALVTPHMIMVVLGAIFCWLGFFLSKAWGALVGAILFTVATALFFVYAMFTIPLLVLGFISYARQKKLSKNVANE